MLSLFWNLSTSLNGYMRSYMHTNRAVDWLRTPRGLKWAIPVALVATPTYMFAMSVCATLVERGGPGYLNALVLMFAWNSIKCAVMGVLTPMRWLTLWHSRSPEAIRSLRTGPRNSGSAASARGSRTAATHSNL